MNIQLRGLFFYQSAFTAKIEHILVKHLRASHKIVSLYSELN